ncbi:McrB family protein [Bradyrhizobium sp. CCBAU 65884]|uniref:McrB family protein n=1 Tax=Bradyrhizobium sp. CCBAU 65884 TaxID=722477 RepID=UPI0023067464|nr:AAA family ATPase [Bradyrhizobium sp. CCBAU 65884]
MDASQLVLPAIIVLTALALVMSGIAIMFQIRRDRLPDATRFEHIRELRAQEEGLLAERRAELSVVEQKIQQRDRLIAEVASLEEQRTAIKAEHATLQDARREIEEVKSQAAEVAGELAKVSQQLDEKQAELEQITDECNPEKLEFLKRELAQVTAEHDAISSQLPALRAERDIALRQIEEAKTSIALEAARTIERDNLAKEIEDLQGEKEPLEALRKEADRVRAARDALAEEIARLESRKARLELETGGEIGESDQKKLLDDLTKVPFSLEFPAIKLGAPRTESEALHFVNEYLKAYNLEYSTRTVLAFHTALKINDHSQLTVLAGVSGTGKSLLPRRYAEAMGIHFLQIAVEPRWDSPQDLLGFYNYIEKNYRATDLARLLVHMDPYKSVALSDADRSDHLALVLLDEMNLARVEYYFSEFLSRLEARPRYHEAGDERKRADAMIPIDIRGLKTATSLFPAHNVLFAGTMNDDESTQSLSDKVLDRSNILQFAAPHEFHNLNSARGGDRPAQAQSFKSWRTWVRPATGFNGAARSAVDAAINKLAEIMEDCGRPFGHRLRDAMIAYVANYPKPQGDDYRLPLADQIELRILPKLRGLEIDSHRAAFDKLDRLLRDELNDLVMAERVAELRERQARGTGLFVWRGLMREG